MLRRCCSLNVKYPAYEYVLEHLVPSYWSCLGRLWSHWVWMLVVSHRAEGIGIEGYICWLYL